MKKEPFKQSKDCFLKLDVFSHHNDSVVAGFSTRKGGYSQSPFDSLNMGLHVNDDNEKVILNRNKLANKINVPLTKWIFTEQVHGNSIKKIFQSDCGKGTKSLLDAIGGTDGIYTQDENVLLTSLYADCVPLYFYTAKKELVGLAHAGWKGTVTNIGGEMVKRWVEQENVSVEDIYVAIGPSISARNYEVDEYIIAKVENLQIEGPLPYKPIEKGRFLLDLRLLNKLLLLHCGIKEENIYMSNYCTFEQSDLFYSYRRNNETGRMMSFIGLFNC